MSGGPWALLSVISLQNNLIYTIIIVPRVYVCVHVCVCVCGCVGVLTIINIILGKKDIQLFIDYNFNTDKMNTSVSRTGSKSGG